MDERRESQRHRTFLAGKVIFGANRFQIDCSVRDLSSGGARLSLADPLAVPSVFELHLPARGTVVRAEVRWRKGRRSASCSVPCCAGRAPSRSASPKLSSASPTRIPRAS